VKLDELHGHPDFRYITELLLREQVMLSISPPVGPRGAWSVKLYDHGTGELGVGRSPNAMNALILATASLERANVQLSQESKVRNVPDLGEIVAKEAS